MFQNETRRDLRIAFKGSIMKSNAAASGSLHFRCRRRSRQQGMTTGASLRPNEGSKGYSKGGIQLCRLIRSEFPPAFMREKEALGNLNFTDKDRIGELDTQNLIKSLGKDLKDTVTLYYLEDFSVKEISEILEIPEGTVKSRLSRARKELEKILIKNEETERRDLNG